MKRKTVIHKLFWMAVAPSLFIMACHNEKRTAEQQASKKTYTCPMHPQIIQDDPGNCPICGMELVLFDKSNQRAYLTLGPEQQALANISTMVIGGNDFSAYRALNGRLTTNPTATQYVSSRNAGRVQVLYIKENGIRVQKGQVVYQLYSEELLTLQQELLMTHKQATQFKHDARFQELYLAARKKLLLYGQTKQQLEQLIQNNKTAPYITFYSPASGVVAELLIKEGQYVQEGSDVMRLEAYGSLWVEADLYPKEAEQLHIGQQLQIDLPGSARPISTAIQFISPTLDNEKQTVTIRGTITNPDGQLQAGMPVRVRLPEAHGAEGITIPSNAIIRQEENNHVWIALGENRFAPRQVQTGKEDFDQTVITSGLKKGDRVVISGAYLLYSEYVLKKGKQPFEVARHK